MENYKIKVNGPDNSAEIQDLFFELGYVWVFSKKDITNLDATYIYAKDGVLTAGFNDLNFAKAGHQELTLPQLRDLVVLKRKDINDANHMLRGNHYYKSSRGDWYFYGLNSWQHSTLTDLEGIEPIQKSEPEPTQEQGLISGADALKAMMEGKRVLYSGYGNQNWDTALNCNLGVFLRHEKFPDFSFKIVPRTLNIQGVELNKEEAIKFVEGYFS